MKSVLKNSALEMADKIKSREITPVELVEAHIERILEVNLHLNAVAEDLFTEARQIAIEQTQFLNENPQAELPPFFGVPMTVKEMLAYKGKKRTAGHFHHQFDIKDYHATIVERMIEAGAIPLCTTNVPELGFWFETNNVIYGRTNNPYDLTRTPGGSSGGEAALIGAGASPMGLGSDIGGSIRMPAAFCGIFGHKPTEKIIPFTGHFPHEKNDFQNKLRGEKYPWTASGPMAKTASDLYAMMKVLVGSDDIDLETKKDFDLKPMISEFNEIQFYILSSPIFENTAKTDADVQLSIEQIADDLRAKKLKVKTLPQDIFKEATKAWFAAVERSSYTKYEENLNNVNENYNPYIELAKTFFSKSKYTVPSIVLTILDRWNLGGKENSKEYYLKKHESYREQIQTLLGENAILLCPAHPRVAPKHNGPIFRPFDFMYTAFFTTMGTPATVAPIGFDSDYLPMSLQIVAGRGQDHLTLSFAKYIEENYGGWIPPRTQFQ